MDLHVVWGWLDTVLNGYETCFVRLLFIYLTALYCEAVFTDNVEADWSFSST